MALVGVGRQWQPRHETLYVLRAVGGGMWNVVGGVMGRGGSGHGRWWEGVWPSQVSGVSGSRDTKLSMFCKRGVGGERAVAGPAGQRDGVWGGVGSSRSQQNCG